MSLSNALKKQYKAIAHNLKPVVMIGDKAITEGILKELDRALTDHELIKVKINIGDRDDRKAIIDELITQTESTLVQQIGKMAVLLKKSNKPNPKLSNLIRNQHQD